MACCCAAYDQRMEAFERIQQKLYALEPQTDGGISGKRHTGCATSRSVIFSPSPGALENGVILHSPTRQRKIVVGWSVLDLAMVVLTGLSKGGNPAARLFYMMLGATFATALWVFASHTRSLELSANGKGLRMTSVLGWRDVPWEMVHGVEMEEIFTTYYNGNMRMWELPFPGSTVRVLSFNDKQGGTLLSFSPELEPKEGLKQLFELCAQRTGSTLERRKITVPF